MKTYFGLSSDSHAIVQTKMFLANTTHDDAFMKLAKHIRLYECTFL